MTDKPRKGWAQASLRISSDTMSFEWITDQLGISADIGGNAGDPGPGTSTRRSTLWVLKSGLSNEHLLAEHITALLDRLTGRDAALATIAEHCRLEIFAGAFADNGQIGETVPWTILKALGERQIDLNLDLYPAGSSERDEPTD